MRVFSRDFSKKKSYEDCNKIEEISRETAGLSKTILTHCVITFFDLPVVFALEQNTVIIL